MRNCSAIAKLSLCVILFVLTNIRPSHASDDFLVLENKYEIGVESFWSQKFNLHDGHFYIWERSTNPTSGENSDHHVARISALDGSKEVYPTIGRGRFKVLKFLDGYVLASDGIYNRTSLYDAKDFTRLGSKRLSDSILESFITENSLILVQSATGGPIQSKFSIPDMRYLGESKGDVFAGYESFKTFRGDFVGLRRLECTREVCRYTFEFFDLQGRLSKSVEIAARAKYGRHCGPSFQIFNDAYAIVQGNCGQYFVVDLENKKLLYGLPEFAESNFYKIAVADRHIIIRPDKDIPSDTRLENTEPVSILDIETGAVVAKQHLPHGSLLSYGNKIILKRVRKYRTLDIEVYGLNDDVLSDADGRMNLITKTAKEARSKPDPYQSLRHFESVALDPLISENIKDLGSEQFQSLIDYARYLALNPHRVEEGIEILERVIEAYPTDSKLGKLFTAATLRAKLFEVDSQAREATLAGNWLPVEERPIFASGTGQHAINFGAFSEQIHFHDEKVIIACWDCEADGQARSGIEIYDRDSWEHLASIPVMQSDSGKQASIANLIVSNDRIYVSVHNRYPDPGEKNLFVYDLNTYEKLAEVAGPSNGTMQEFEESQSNACVCNRQECLYFNLKNLEMSDKADGDDLICPRSVLEASREEEIIKSSSRYYVTRRGRQDLTFHPLNAPDQAIPFPFRVSNLGWDQVYFYDDGAKAVIMDKSLDVMRLYTFDIASKTNEILIEIPLGSHFSVVSGDQALFISLGRTILAIDLKTGKIIDWADPFLSTSSDSTQQRPQRIDRLVVDRGNLIALGRNGPSRIIDLHKLYALSSVDNTPFARTEKVLTSFEFPLR